MKTAVNNIFIGFLILTISLIEKLMRPYVIGNLYLLCFVLLISCSEKKAFDLPEASIDEIHQAITAGDCSCESLVQGYLDRIKAYDQSTGLNAIVVTNPKALEIAKQYDTEFQQTKKLKPLHCIPLIVKDNYQTKGLQTTAGSLTFEGFIPEEDAYQVKVLKEAGAIVLAKSNMAEWAFSPMVTISSIAGETHNPYNLDHTTAGSSGGTAAAVAASLGTVGLGTDTGNSIRGPSSHNALVGFRPTLGLTSRHGIVPLYMRNDTGGPMARTVTDATKILEVIAGYDSADMITRYSRGRIPDNYQQFLKADGLKGARIGVLRMLTEDIDPQIKTLFEQAIADLKNAGATMIDSVEIAGFDSLRRNQWCPMFGQDINQYLANLGDQAPIENIDQIIASGKYADYIAENLKSYQHLDVDTLSASCEDAYHDIRRVTYRQAVEQAMDENDVEVLIYPSWNYPPARIGDFSGYKGDNSQIIAPHTGQPAFTVPMGFTYENLPAGLQFLGRMFDEPTLITYTFAYEQATHHRKAPEKFPALSEK